MAFASNDDVDEGALEVIFGVQTWIDAAAVKPFAIGNIGLKNLKKVVVGDAAKHFIFVKKRNIARDGAGKTPGCVVVGDERHAGSLERFSLGWIVFGTFERRKPL